MNVIAYMYIHVVIKFATLVLALSGVFTSTNFRLKLLTETKAAIKNLKTLLLYIVIDIYQL